MTRSSSYRLLSQLLDRGKIELERVGGPAESMVTRLTLTRNTDGRRIEGSIATSRAEVRLRKSGDLLAAHLEELLANSEGGLL